MDTIDQYPFVFFGALFEIYQTSPDDFYLSLKMLCDSFGLNYDQELEKIETSDFLAGNFVTLKVPVVQENNSTEMCTTACLRLESLPFWVCKLDSCRVKLPYKKEIMNYQADMANALWEINYPKIAAYGIQAMFPKDVPPRLRKLASYWKKLIISDQSESFEYIRKVFYGAKILGICWFEGEIPSDEKETFVIYSNPDLREPAGMSKELDTLMKLGESELLSKCETGIKPEWVGPKTHRRIFKIEQLPGLLEEYLSTFAPEKGNKRSS
jgi:hypothetical protein